MSESSIRVNVIGGTRLTREIFTHIVAEAGLDPYSDNTVMTNLEVAMVIVEDEFVLTNDLPRQSVVVTTDHADDEIVTELVLNGADAVLSMHSSPQDLANAIRTVAEGGSVIAPKPARRVTELARTNRITQNISLTNREIDILKSIQQGESVKQTAEALGIAPKTVENLQSRLFRKLNVRNRAQAFAHAHALGLL